MSTQHCCFSFSFIWLDLEFNIQKACLLTTAQRVHWFFGGVYSFVRVCRFVNKNGLSFILRFGYLVFLLEGKNHCQACHIGMCDCKNIMAYYLFVMLTSFVLAVLNSMVRLMSLHCPNKRSRIEIRVIIIRLQIAPFPFFFVLLGSWSCPKIRVLVISTRGE